MRPRSPRSERHASATRPGGGDPRTELPSSPACVTSDCKTYPYGDKLAQFIETRQLSPIVSNADLYHRIIPVPTLQWEHRQDEEWLRWRDWPA
jgi:hypothetical protein